jgi:predicted DNA-binding transcriptional regulator AlpA
MCVLRILERCMPRIPVEQVNPLEIALKARPQRRHRRQPNPALAHTLPPARGPPDLDVVRLLTTEQTAGVLGISIDTLSRMSARGEGPQRIKISPRRVAYRLFEIEAWLAQRAAAY